MKNYLIGLVGFVCWAMAVQVEAQTIQSISQGISAHVYGQYANWNSNSHFLSDISSEDPSGIGLGVELRYGFSSIISGYLSYGTVNFNKNKEWETYKSGMYRLGGQYNFGGTTAALRPYLNAGAVYQNFKLARIFINDMGTTVVDNGELLSKGIAVEVGGGVKYHVIPEFVVELSVAGQFGKLGSNFVDGREFYFQEKIDTQHLFVRLGIGYFIY